MLDKFDGGSTSESRWEGIFEIDIGLLFILGRIGSEKIEETLAVAKEDRSEEVLEPFSETFLTLGDEGIVCPGGGNKGGDEEPLGRELEGVLQKV